MTTRVEGDKTHPVDENGVELNIILQNDAAVSRRGGVGGRGYRLYRAIPSPSGAFALQHGFPHLRRWGPAPRCVLDY